MSRFFAMRTSDNDSDYSSSDEGGMGGQMQNREQAQAAMLMYDSSSSEEEKRVVRSAKDKRYEALSSTIKVLRNSVKINDWVQALKTFEQLGKVMDKSKNIIQKEGIPRMYIKAISDLDLRVNEVAQDKEYKVKMSTANNKALNTLKQKLRKNNKEYERFIAEYRVAPDAHSEEEQSEDESESESEQESGSEPESESESESSEEEDEERFGDGATESDFSDFSDESESSESSIDLSHPAMSRSFWMKKTKGDEEEMTKAERRRQKAPKDKEKKSKQKAEAKEEKEIEYTPELIHQKLNAIQSMRGKRGADRYQAIRDLRLLSTKASSVPAVLKVKITLMSAMFDVNFNSGTHMQVPLWQQACQILDEILAALIDNPDVHLIEDDDIEETVFAGDELLEDGAPLPIIDESKPVLEAGELRTFAPQARRKRDDGQEYVAGSIYSFAARLSDEYIASLQSIDPHTQEYLDRLNDEPTLMLLLARSQDYYQSIKKMQFIGLLSMLRVEYLYVKYDPCFDMQSTSYRKTQQDPLALLLGDDILLHRLCSLVYQGNDGRSKARAIICTAYHYAMHGHFCKARDVFLMAHIQDSIQQADISTQILYNRALAMMSVCAFRLGLLSDALNLVADLYATGKIKELLAQGVSQRSWQQDRDTEQEKLERRRQVPYHMHISLDLLESVHLVSAMLLEVPNLAVHAADDKRHVISRNFRRLWDSFHKNAFNGPPENTRDFVIASAIALSDGDWKSALEHLLQLKMWSLIPFSELAQAALTMSVKEVALETFLLALGANYTTISGERLATRFDMSERDVHAIASRLMANDRLLGAWDAATKSIHMKAILPNELQSAALHFADQIGVLVEQNERSLEHRHSHGKYGVVGGKETNVWQSRPLQAGRTRPGDDRRW